MGLAFSEISWGKPLFVVLVFDDLASAVFLAALIPAVAFEAAFFAVAFWATFFAADFAAALGDFFATDLLSDLALGFILELAVFLILVFAFAVDLPAVLVTDLATVLAVVLTIVLPATLVDFFWGAALVVFFAVDLVVFLEEIFFFGAILFVQPDSFSQSLRGEVLSMIKSLKHRIIKGLTPDVKDIRAGSQLQRFRSYRSSRGWIFEFDFFPGPKKGLWLFRSPEDSYLGLFAPSSEQKGLHRSQSEIKPDPVQLYLRAHLVNQRLVETPKISENLEVLEISFVFEGGGSLSFAQEGTSSLIDVKVNLPGQKKPFVRHVQLDTLDMNAGDEGDSATLENEVKTSTRTTEITKQAQKLERKQLQLLTKVQKDIDDSRAGLKSFDAICAHLQADPTSWGIDHKWQSDLLGALSEMIANGDLPAFKVETRSQAQDRIFSLRRRYVRKLQGAQKRMQEVIAQPGKKIEPSEKPVSTQQKPGNKGPGQRFELPGGILVLIGKKQSDNADLFRKAHSRDYWFHIRGMGGAHVWIPRNQKGIDQKGELSVELQNWGAQLALYNSKARSSRYGMVDFTEKRHLKSIKGQPGHLIISRSKTLATELDADFESKIQGL